MIQEWQKYSVSGYSETGSWFSDSCSQFERAFHVAHLTDALRIIEDKVIRSSLIWDESKLNNSRTCVSWLSPNTWAFGSIYGNIRFEFDWTDIINGKRFYWVEAMEQYSPPAYRILVTDKDYDKIELVAPYDPCLGNGPLFSRNNKWYRNGRYNGEFMIDLDLPLSLCKQIRFDDHHSRICSKDSNCLEKGQEASDAGARFLANLIGKRQIDVKSLFLEKDGANIRTNSEVQSALLNLSRVFLRDLEGKETVKNPTASGWGFFTDGIALNWKDRALQVRHPDLQCTA
jgi:hypothetical protein